MLPCLWYKATLARRKRVWSAPSRFLMVSGLHVDRAVSIIEAFPLCCSFTGIRTCSWLQRDQGNHQQANRPVLPCSSGGVLVPTRGRGARATFVKPERRLFGHAEILYSKYGMLQHRHHSRERVMTPHSLTGTITRLPFAIFQFFTTNDSRMPMPASLCCVLQVQRGVKGLSI